VVGWWWGLGCGGVGVGGWGGSKNRQNPFYLVWNTYMYEPSVPLGAADPARPEQTYCRIRAGYIYNIDDI
jgi:hypothetical protein